MDGVPASRGQSREAALDPTDGRKGHKNRRYEAVPVAGGLMSNTPASGVDPGRLMPDGLDVFFVRAGVNAGLALLAALAAEFQDS